MGLCNYQLLLNTSLMPDGELDIEGIRMTTLESINQS